MAVKRIIWLEEEGYRYVPRDHPKPTDPYQILDVSTDTTDLELKKAYRRKAAKFHPDRWHDFAVPWATKQMQAVNAAYEAILKERAP